MSTTITERKLQRTYTVRIRPTEATTLATVLQDEGIGNDGWYEPREVVLQWDPDKAPERFTEAELRRIALRAEKLERQEFDTPPERSFEVEVVELVREQLVTPRRRR